jgi:hypothetical protein
MWTIKELEGNIVSFEIGDPFPRVIQLKKEDFQLDISGDEVIIFNSSGPYDFFNVRFRLRTFVVAEVVDKDGGEIDEFLSAQDLYDALEAIWVVYPDKSSVATGWSTEWTFDLERYMEAHTALGDIEIIINGTGAKPGGSVLSWITMDGTKSLLFVDNGISYTLGGDITENGEVLAAGTYLISALWGNDSVSISVTLASERGILASIGAPKLLSAVIENATPNQVDYTFDEVVTITTAGWSMSASGGAVTIDSVVSGSGTTTPKLGLSRSIANGETVTISYNPATGNTTDEDGNKLTEISGAEVTNSVEAVEEFEYITWGSLTDATYDDGTKTVTGSSSDGNGLGLPDFNGADGSEVRWDIPNPSTNSDTAVCALRSDQTTGSWTARNGTVKHSIYHSVGKIYTSLNGVHPNSNINVTAGSIFSLLRSGSNLIYRYSTDGGENWTTIRTETYISGAVYFACYVIGSGKFVKNARVKNA